YRPPDGGILQGPAHEIAHRELVFVERAGTDGTTRVVSVSQAYPATSRRVLFTTDGQVRSVFPMDTSLVVSFRRAGGAAYGLWRLGGGELQPLLASDSGHHAVEPVVAAPRARPLGFVSATDPNTPNGTLYGTDARLTGLGARDSTAAVLRVHTPTGELGTVPLAADGSFHVDLPADTPLRFETLDSLGRTVRGPSAWVWVRPGELRGCVGCHESRALAPDNRMPIAATRPATRLGDSPATTDPGRVPGRVSPGPWEPWRRWLSGPDWSATAWREPTCAT
ncbi:MAG: hypothetical protein ACOC5I_00155, partial [Gemmatimonadota bacterium]